MGQNKTAAFRFCLLAACSRDSPSLKGGAPEGFRPWLERGYVGFLEICAGGAGLTLAMRSEGCRTGQPIDILYRALWPVLGFGGR